MKQGLLITFEGIEGSGKSTQLRLAADWLKDRGIPLYCSREPGGTEIGAEIRKILLSQKTVALAPFSETLLYLADRFQHITEILLPRLESGDLVLCDRYHDSTVAYQGYARGISLELISQIWSRSGLAIEPDLTLLFDVDPEIGIRRSLEKLQEQRLDESRFEQEAIEFHTRVREGFLALSRENPERIVLVDAVDAPDDVHRSVRNTLEKFLKSKGLL
jgi:dTMP kinase